jgi:dTMP kinase
MKKNAYPGKFIVFEGLDGSGQTTQSSLLRDYLVGSGKVVLLTKEPTNDSSAAKEIRRVLDESDVVDSLKLQKLFTQDRREHLNNLIEPALKRGEIVISDRYFFSTFAFGTSDGLDLEELIMMNDEFLLPDLTIILKVSPEVCVQRIEERGLGIKLFEKMEKLERVWKTYQLLPERFENVHVVDGERPIEAISEEIKGIFNEKLS